MKEFNNYIPKTPQPKAALLKSKLILELTGCGISSTEIMSSNISDPLLKKYDNPREKVKKAGIWMKPRSN